MGVPLNADALSSARCLGERGFALLSQHWQTLQDVTASPGRIGLIARVARVALVFGAIRAPDAHVRVTEKTSVLWRVPAPPSVNVDGGPGTSDFKMNAPS